MLIEDEAGTEGGHGRCPFSTLLVLEGVSESSPSLAGGARAASPRKDLICCAINALRAFIAQQIKSGKCRRRNQVNAAGASQRSEWQSGRLSDEKSKSA